ncbi:PREDICTED: uncharacterized protein LOC108557464 isoform X2 [Nicrophorus vespilloides]|uniref:Uncharacterized protein LOC108557464 isoform X2 n=1 Tax=Nicrophorus vespilloides TaxID=110193 RepID=A0ABM1M4G0_NICVS|nr:PREDICTED: uncharacterized protein LOC108557464 isoform X2 [Nicrophorus vespilloides]
MFSIFLILIYACRSHGYGYDAGTDQGACGKPYRASRMYQPPCDLTKQTYCINAGTMYPWHAVKRFIRENQGLMRRMYGDEKHFAVLKAELESNEDYSGEDRYRYDDDLYGNGDYKSRYAKQNSDFENDILEEREDVALEDVADEEEASHEPGMQIKLKDLQPPRFRPTSTTSTTTTTTSTTTTSTQRSVEDLEAKTLNKTVELLYENSTEIFYEVDDDNANNITTTDLSEEDGTTTEYQQETTTQKKEPSLFQEPDKTKNMLKLTGVNACPVKEEVVAPFWANNTRGEVLALLNMQPFEQYVHWEKCTHENRQMHCREGCRCEQKYRLHRMLAYDPNNECRGIFSDWFLFPSCCICKCYDLQLEIRITSRSPRSRDPEKGIPSWFKKKTKKGFNKD